MFNCTKSLRPYKLTVPHVSSSLPHVLKTTSRSFHVCWMRKVGKGNVTAMLKHQPSRIIIRFNRKNLAQREYSSLLIAHIGSDPILVIPQPTTQIRGAGQGLEDNNKSPC